MPTNHYTAESTYCGFPINARVKKSSKIGHLVHKTNLSIAVDQLLKTFSYRSRTLVIRFDLNLVKSEDRNQSLPPKFMEKLKLSLKRMLGDKNAPISYGWKKEFSDKYKYTDGVKKKKGLHYHCWVAIPLATRRHPDTIKREAQEIIRNLWIKSLDPERESGVDLCNFDQLIVIDRSILLNDAERVSSKESIDKRIEISKGHSSILIRPLITREYYDSDGNKILGATPEAIGSLVDEAIYAISYLYKKSTTAGTKKDYGASQIKDSDLSEKCQKILEELRDKVENQKTFEEIAPQILH